MNLEQRGEVEVEVEVEEEVVLGGDVDEREVLRRWAAARRLASGRFCRRLAGGPGRVRRRASFSLLMGYKECRPNKAILVQGIAPAGRRGEQRAPFSPTSGT